ncbi:MAG: pseudouridine synthase [Gammaproteobacteria bacterium]|nr:MAG: pseudouridine synthase [Gammaproteobacteria bacterium]
MLNLISTNKRSSLATLVCCTALLASSASFADQIKKITEVEGISEYRLDNGLQILLFPDQTKETVTVNMTYHVGSKNENYGETGMAHLLEHLVFKGSPKHKDIPAELSSHGARPNGSTWTDRTNYFETFSATEKNINWALDLEADRMVNSFIAKKDLDSEMTVVRNEFESGENSPFGVTMKRMMATAFAWHNYGKSTIGARTDIENVPIGRLQAFYKKHYQPDNATLIVAGKFKNKTMLARIQKYFASIPKPSRVLPPLYTQEPAQDGERQVTVRRVGDIQLVGALYHIPAGSHPEFSAVEVLNEILSATPNGRLHKKLVENKLASRTMGFNFQWQEPSIALFFSEVGKGENLDKARQAMLDVIENTVKSPITEKELARAKRSLLKQIELRFNSSERVALGLSEWLGMGDWRLMFLNRDRLEKVTLAQVQQVAKNYFVQNNRTLGLFIPTKTPERTEIPQVASVSDMLKNYQGRKLIAQGEAFEPSYKNIDQHTKKITLTNGAKVALLTKKTRGESVVVNIDLNFGQLSSLKNQKSTATVVGAMLMRGTKQHTREQLKDRFDELKAQVRLGGDVNSAYARIQTNKANLAATLDLVAEVLQQPSFDEKEFNLYKGTRKVDLEKRLQDPQALAFNELNRLQNPYSKEHPFYSSTFEEALATLAEVKLSSLAQFHQRFYGANNAEVTVIGDFDVKQVSKKLESLFGHWNSKKSYHRIVEEYKKLAVHDKLFNTPDKENAVFVASNNLPIKDSDKDAPAMQLANYIFGGGFLSSRLATRLRQKDGLSYGAGSFLQLSSHDQRTTMGAYAICAPQNLAKVEIGFKEELARLIKDGFTKEEVAKAKSGLIQGKKVSRSQDRELAGKLNRNLDLNRTMAWNKQFNQQLASLTVDDLNKAVRKYWKVEDFSIIKGGDMSKVK